VQAEPNRCEPIAFNLEEHSCIGRLQAPRPRRDRAAAIAGRGTVCAETGQGASASSREIKLDPDPTSVRAARHFVRSNLYDLGFPESVDDGELIVSELVTNSLRHAPQMPCLLAVRIGAGHPVIEVHDFSPDLPEKREPDLDSVHGRGLLVVEALCKDWDCVRSSSGKAVIVTLHS
jgi:anti-sigma regulatory factor (Ser/Thr protein kinase)